MRLTIIRHLKVVLTVIFALSPYSAWSQIGFPNFNNVWGHRYQAVPSIAGTAAQHPVPNGNGPANRIRHWNQIAINASGLDHTPVAPGENRVFGEQYGPTRASRAMAIVHIAIFEAVNAIRGHYRSYAGISPVPNDASID